MSLSEFQKAVERLDTAMNSLEYAAVRLGGEAGEALNQIAKFTAVYGDKIPADERKALIAEELGDTLYCVARVSSRLQLDLEAISLQVLEKMQSRKT